MDDDRYLTPFEGDPAAAWSSKLWQSLLNVAIFLLIVIVTTVAIVLLYKYRCYKVRLTCSLSSQFDVPSCMRSSTQYMLNMSNKSSAVAEMGDRARAKWAKKWGAAVPLSVGGAGSPSNTMSPWPWPISVPSGILIHQTVWPQYTNVTDRQTGHRSDSTGRTVLQTVGLIYTACDGCRRQS